MTNFKLNMDMTTNNTPSDNKSKNNVQKLITTSKDEKSITSSNHSLNNRQTSTSFQDSLEMTFSGYILFSTIAATIASFNTGYTTAVTNIPNDTIRGMAVKGNCSSSFLSNCVYTESNFKWGFAIGLYALGGFFGSLVAGKISDKLGRRNAIILSNIPFLLGGIFLSTAMNITSLGIGRFLCGISSGGGSVMISSYIGEIAPVKRRGTFGSVLQFCVVIGIFVSNLLGYLIVSIGINQTWRILLGLTSALALVQMVVFTRCPETPRYLIMKGKVEQAHKNLQALRKGHNIEKEFDQMVTNANNQTKNSAENMPLTLTQTLCEKKYLKSILIIIVIHMIQQLSGINGVISYSTTYFDMSIGKKFSNLSTIALSFLNLVATTLSVYLIDKVGRKALLLTSCLGITVSSLMIVAGSLLNSPLLIVFSVLIFIVTFAVGLGPIPWMLMSEMLPTKMLSSIASLSIGINWLVHFTVTTSFLSINSALKEYTFLPFALVGGLGFIFIVCLLPETKGRTLEEILENA